jgi:hypothetical protein
VHSAVLGCRSREAREELPPLFETYQERKIVSRDPTCCPLDAGSALAAMADLKPQVKYSNVQDMRFWSERCRLEVCAAIRSARRTARWMHDASASFRSQSHHESALPAQRYKTARELPVKVNPIVPQDVSNYTNDGS